MKHFKILILTLIVATSYAQEGIRPWEMRNANGSGYVMISGIDSVMYYDVLDNYIKDTLGYSRIDSIKCVSDTIRIYTNNGQFKMPFSCSGGGSGTVTSVAVAAGTTGTDVNVTGSPITTSGTITVNIPTASATNRGALSSTDWSTFNSKIGGSGLANRLTIFNGTGSVTSNGGLLFDHSSLKMSLGESVDTTTSWLPLANSGLILRGTTSTGIAFATTGGSYDSWQTYINDNATTGRYAIWSDASPAGDRFWINYGSSQPFFSYLTGTNNRLVQTSSTGGLSALANGTSGQVLTSTGSGYQWQAVTVSEVDGVIGNEILNVQNNGLARSGAGTAGDPYTVTLSGVNLQLANLGNGTTNNGKYLQSTGTGLQWTSVSGGTSGLTTYASLNNNTLLYQLPVITSTPKQIPFGIGPTGTGVTVNGSGQVVVPSTGKYELTYGMAIACDHPNDFSLESGLYINANTTPLSGSTFIPDEITPQNDYYTIAHSMVTDLTSGQLIIPKVKVLAATQNSNLYVLNAYFTIKKLN